MIQRKRRRIKRLLAALFGALLAGAALAWARGWYAPGWDDLPLAAILLLAVYNLGLLLAQRSSR